MGKIWTLITNKYEKVVDDEIWNREVHHELMINQEQV